MNLIDFHNRYHDELSAVGEDNTVTMVKVLEAAGEILELMEVEYEPETKTLWIKVDG